MKLIAILISLVLDRLLGVGSSIRCTRCLLPYLNLLGKGLAKLNIATGWTGVVFSLIPVVLVTWILQHLFSSWGFGLLGLIFAVLILVYCLGPHCVQDQLKEYKMAVASGDAAVIQKCYIQLVGDTADLTTGQMGRNITQAIFIKSNQTVFAVLFWFFIFGPVGAMLYRFLDLLQDTGKNNSTYESFINPATQLLKILDWIPVRLLTISYALVGDFEGGFSYWWEHLISGTASNNNLLVKCGLAAIGAEAENEENAAHENDLAMALVERSVIVWVLVVLIWTLAHWVV